ncbi:MAG: hypothetical protein Q9P90_12830 [candidate division KSB1 bacterium]|nr:hypothetical protein [candidate division KSB1 bacterium]
MDRKLEALRLEEILPIKPPPPPPPQQVPVPPMVIAEPDEVPEEITTPIRPVEKKRRRRRPRDDSKISLDLAMNTGLTVPNNPTLDLSQPLANSRMRPGSEGVDLGIEAPDAPTGMVRHRSPSLDLEGVNAERGRKKPTIAVQDDFELPEPTSLKTASYIPEPQERQTAEDLLGADVSLVIASTDLSMGVEEYKLWNRINGEFDRWDKGRYGIFPANLRRRGRAIIASFVYGNGVSHTIVWLRGNTKIYVKGTSTQNRLQELKKALTSMIQLNLKRSGF